MVHAGQYKHRCISVTETCDKRVPAPVYLPADRRCKGDPLCEVEAQVADLRLTRKLNIFCEVRIC